MKKVSLAVIALSALVSISSFAKTFELQFESEKIGSINFPDSWNVNQSREFIEAWSADKTAHVVFEIVPMKSSSPATSPHRIAPNGADIEDVFADMDAANERDKILEGTVGDFKDDQVEIDQSTKKMSDSEQLLGPKLFTFEGKRDGKPLTAGAGVIVVASAHKVLAFTYWCLDEKEKERKPEIAKILKEIKIAGSKKS